MEYGSGDCDGRLLELLSPREREVLEWLRMGKTSWDMSKILRISERTVNYHVNNIIRKLGVVSRLQAVSVAANFDAGEGE
jgi:DNA-binding CsgD family transcriptional regulator